MVLFRTTLLAAAVVAAIASGAASAADISGAGATFPYPIYAKWADAYKQKTGNAVNYQSIGSGGGIKQITAKTVDFGASDMPLNPARSCRRTASSNGRWSWAALCRSSICRGIQPGQLKLDGEVLAEIYLGNDHKMERPGDRRSSIPDLNLPDKAIAPVYRSDGSGTTFIFTALPVEGQTRS